MTKRRWLMAAIGLLGGFILVSGLSVPSPAEAQMTKEKVRKEAKERAIKGKVKWESLSPEEQAEVKKKAKEEGIEAKEKWESMSAEEQQEARAKAKTTAKKVGKKWKSLPAQ